MQTGVLNAGQGKAYWVVGDLYTILASGEDTGGAYALIHAEVLPGGGPPPHIHGREDEAFYVLEGELAFHADGRDIRATAGAWLTLARGSLHTFKNVGPVTARLFFDGGTDGIIRRDGLKLDPSGFADLLTKFPGAGLSNRLPIQVSVDVAVPLEVVWEEWMTAGTLPEGVHRIEEVERDGDRLTGKLAGPRSADWEAEITDERVYESFAWRSSSCAKLRIFVCPVLPAAMSARYLL